MPGPRYRVLTSGLLLFSAIAALAGLVMIFGTRPLIVRLFLNPPESEVSTLLLVMVKEMGGFVLMLTALLYLARRDVVRNVAVIDALIFGLCVLAITPLVSLYTVEGAASLYPTWMWWGRSLLRLGFAALLYYLRPRQTGDDKTGFPQRT